MRKIAWLHQGVLRKVVSRTETTDHLDCGHTLPAHRYYPHQKHRRCLACRDARVDALVESLPSFPERS